MLRYRLRCLTAVAALALAGSAVLTGCSDDDTPSSAVSEAASAAQSLASEAERRFGDIKGGVNAKDAVSLGDPDIGSDGRVSVEATAENTTDSTKSFVVQINLSDPNGNLLEPVVVTISDVPANQSKKATATGKRDLTGDVRAEVERAVRY